MLETNLLARLIDAARTVMPLAPVNAATLALTQLPLGQTVRAQVMARHADGTFRLVINDAPLKLALPANAKTGDVVTLRLVAREPQLQFVLERPSASAETRLSSGARLIGQILSDPAPLRPQQLRPVAAMPIVDATKLREPLARAIQRSGLFYEAHQARWIDGEYPLAALQEEPQAVIARQIRSSDLGALPAPDRALGAGLALAPTTTDHDTVPVRDQAPDPGPALAQTTIGDEASGDPADALERTDARNPHASPSPDAPEDDVPARSSNAPHATATRAPGGSLFDEQVVAARHALFAERAVGTPVLADNDDPAQAGIVRELAPFVRQQLDAIETRQILWQGELWPGQPIRWQIADREADAHHPESGREWLTRFALTLPTLGEVNADLAIGAQGVRIVVTARDSVTADALRGATPELRQALAAAGLQVAALEVRRHER